MIYLQQGNRDRRNMITLITLHWNGQLQDPEQLWNSWRYNNTKKVLVQELNSYPPDKTGFPLKPRHFRWALQPDRPMADTGFATAQTGRRDLTTM